jgi:hypothetical protein
MAKELVPTAILRSKIIPRKIVSIPPPPPPDLTYTPPSPQSADQSHPPHFKKKLTLAFALALSA